MAVFAVKDHVTDHLVQTPPFSLVDLISQTPEEQLNPGGLRLLCSYRRLLIKAIDCNCALSHRVCT